MASHIICKLAAVAALVVSAGLAGCSNSPQQPTAAISPANEAAAATAAGAAAKAADGQAADGQAVAAVAAEGDPAAGSMAAKKQAAAAGFTVPVDRLDCEQMTAEMTLFKSDDTAKKLADFGKAKYKPTAEEHAKFTRMVDVKSAIDERCKPQKKAKKGVPATDDAKKAAMKPKVVSEATAAKKSADPAKIAPAE